MNKNTGNYYTSLISWVLFAIFVMFQLLDTWQTYLLLQTNMIYEANILFRYAIGLFGFVNAAIIFKGSTTIIVLFILIYCQKIDKKIMHNKSL